MTALSPELADKIKEILADDSTPEPMPANSAAGSAQPAAVDKAPEKVVEATPTPATADASGGAAVGEGRIELPQEVHDYATQTGFAAEIFSGAKTLAEAQMIVRGYDIASRHLLTVNRPAPTPAVETPPGEQGKPSQSQPAAAQPPVDPPVEITPAEKKKNIDDVLKRLREGELDETTLVDAFKAQQEIIEQENKALYEKLTGVTQRIDEWEKSQREATQAAQQAQANQDLQTVATVLQKYDAVSFVFGKDGQQTPEKQRNQQVLLDQVEAINRLDNARQGINKPVTEDQVVRALVAVGVTLKPTTPNGSSANGNGKAGKLLQQAATVMGRGDQPNMDPTDQPPADPRDIDSLMNHAVMKRWTAQNVKR